jgi:acyl-CoA dehydrogenase
MTSPPTASSPNSLSYLRPEVLEIQRVLKDFVENDCIPAEAEFERHVAKFAGADRWSAPAIPPCLERLKQRAKALGLWNLFIPPHLIAKIPPHAQHLAPKVPLSYREYGILCETLGRSPYIAPEACNTSAPDTGNMEVLLEFGTRAQQERYLIPLLNGTMRSTFLMTEPHVASSDATNLQTSLTKIVATEANNGGSIVQYRLSGQKWWSTGAMHPHCRLALVVAKMDYSQCPPRTSTLDSDLGKEANTKSTAHGAHTIVAVPLPHPGVTFVRPLSLFGYDDAPHGHAQVDLHNVWLSTDDLILGEGSGFRVSQARLGPGRIHHCMRAIGMGTYCSYNGMRNHSTRFTNILIRVLHFPVFVDLQHLAATNSCCSAPWNDKRLVGICGNTERRKKRLPIPSRT